MDILQLKYFLEVARTEHVTHSARNLRIAQPALTQSIKRLETELGVELFARAGRNIRLTPAGAYLRDRIAPAMEILETAPEDVRAFAAGEAGTVMVGIFSASNVVVDAITAYRASFPAVNFRITQDEFESACDITVSTVMPSSSNARGEGIAVGDRTLFRERIGIAVPGSSSFGDVVSLDDLADEPFVCLAGSRRLREVCDALCAGRAFHPRIGFESDNPAVVRKVIGLGLGVGFWPTCSWEALGDGSARLARLAEEEFERTIALTRASHVREDAAAFDFYRFLVDYVRNRWSEGAARRP